MLNWLLKRLSPVKIDTPRWRELALALEEFWEIQFTPLYDALANLRSIYTADEAGQMRKIAEFGSYYEHDMPAVNRPIYFGMRKLEMLKKETDAPIQMALQRMDALGITWDPLYAMIDQPYGSRFYSLNELKLLMGIDPYSNLKVDGLWKLDDGVRLSTLEDFGIFMTSRGMLQIDLSTFTNFALIPRVVERIKEVKPVDIVFEGVRYEIISLFDITMTTEGTFEGDCLYEIQYPEEPVKVSHFAPNMRKLDRSWKVKHTGMTANWTGI